ncbi:MAG: response regulator [Candidatus Delongbacteria bacterium]|nr:response regulator [Candidatus Delongbacteria bacterium]MBN2837066.1 response regulator [Candidatus Delongbacteria bacterium]
MKNLLIVDDNDDFRELLVSAFEAAGYKVFGAINSKTGLDAIKNDKFDLVITDFYMPKGNGIDFLESIKKHDSTLPVIILTGFSDKEILSNALKAGAVNFLDKSISLQDLISYVQSILILFGSRGTISNVGLGEALEYIKFYKKTICHESNEKVLSKIPQYIINDLVSSKMLSEEESMPVTIVLVEALSNALYHGNLEVESEIRDNSFLGQKTYKNIIEEKQNDPFYAKRVIEIECYCDKSMISFTITDEGKGFEWQKKREVNLSSGRGFLIINSFSDVVEFNEKGNQIKIVKYRTKK